MEKRLLDIVVCPFCKGKLHYAKKTQELICNFDKLAFPIRNNIPIMLLEQARSLNDDEKQKVK